MPRAAGERAKNDGKDFSIVDDGGDAAPAQPRRRRRDSTWGWPRRSLVACAWTMSSARVHVYCRLPPDENDVSKDPRSEKNARERARSAASGWKEFPDEWYRFAPLLTAIAVLTLPALRSRCLLTTRTSVRLSNSGLPKVPAICHVGSRGR